MLYGFFYRNPINVRQIELLTICLYSEGSEDRFAVVQHLWCRKICQIVCRVSRKWMESKFLDQDVDIVSLANKGIVIGCFVGRNYNKILMETGKLTDNIRVTKNGLGSGVDRMFQSSDSAFYHFTDQINPFGKSVEFDILLSGPLKMRQVPWILGLCVKYLEVCHFARYWDLMSLNVPWRQATSIAYMHHGNLYLVTKMYKVKLSPVKCHDLVQWLIENATGLNIRAYASPK